LSRSIIHVTSNWHKPTGCNMTDSIMRCNTNLCCPIHTARRQQNSCCRWCEMTITEHNYSVRYIIDCGDNQIR